MIVSDALFALEGGCIAALGTFDGVHLGHRRVLAEAAQAGLPVAVVTFAQNPQSVLGRQAKQRILSPARCDALFEELGVAAVIRLDFVSVRNLAPETFLDRLVAELGAKGFACGYNFRFGRQASGSADTLTAYATERGLFVSVCEPVTAMGEAVSSSRIRAAIAAGDMETANAMLGSCYRIDAPVDHGDARGRLLGFPTLNQALDDTYILPRTGVYASRVAIDGVTYPAVTNIGVRPTFGATPAALAESFVIGFSGNLYGERVCVELLRFLRPEQKFDSPEALIAQMKRDAAEAAKE